MGGRGFSVSAEMMNKKDFTHQVILCPLLWVKSLRFERRDVDCPYLVVSFFMINSRKYKSLFCGVLH